MRVLFDTHLLIWAAIDPKRLPDLARQRLEDPETSPVFSVVSIWEVVIKLGLGRDDFRLDAHLLRRGLLESGYEELAISGRHALGVIALPAIHRDPFDRMLIAQAMAEELPLVTSDQTLAAYPGPVQLV